MRSSKSRSRSKNRNHKPQGNVVNRVFDSSGPEGKVRGTPQQIIDKYNQLARDAQLSGDRVALENFQQHAEHYLRLLAEATREQEARREEQERQNRERQAQRDRERQERMERQERDSPPAQNQAQADPSEAPQPDVIDTSSGESGLVETPEEQRSEATPAPSSAAAAPEDKPKRARRPRKPKTPKAETSAPSDKADQPAETADAPSGQPPEAAE